MIRSVRVGLRRVEYTLITSRARTTVLLQALPEGKIRVYAPAGVSLREMDSAVKNHMAEIDRAHAGYERAAAHLPDTVLLRGRRLPLKLIPAEGSRISVQDGALRVLTPYRDSASQKEQIKRYLSKQALACIREELDRWAPTVKRDYGRVAVREQRSRWGSCSAKQNLNFNWKLVMAPPQALTYVVIHELCHLLYFNHSAKFWAEVERRMPDYRIWKNWLKQHGGELTL